MARDFNLSQQFQLNEVGNYSVSAVIRSGNKQVEGATTNRTHFQLSAGRPYWSQKVGNVGPNRSVREFRLLQFRGDKATQLFFQIQDDDSGRIVRTAALGNVLMLRKPSITIDGERFQPMQVEIDRQQGANAWLTVGIREGKNREIRRAMEAIGLPVNRLLRVSYGPFRLGALKAGEVQEVKQKVMRDQLGLKKPDS